MKSPCAEQADLHALAYTWELCKLEKVGRILRSGSEWLAAADLALWCLQTKPERRPHSFREVRAHRFFVPEGPLRYVQVRLCLSVSASV